MAKKAGLKWWQWLAIALGAIVIAGTVTGVSIASKDEVKLNAAAYQVADVDEQGRVYEAKTAIVSKFIETDEIEVVFEDKAEVSVQAHFFDKDEAYLSSSAVMTEDGTITLPEGATYARIELVHETDTEISFTEKIEYAGQVDIIYAR